MKVILKIVNTKKKIENARAEAEIMKQQNAQITDQTLKLKEFLGRF